jgi:hypothetical protein
VNIRSRWRRTGIEISPNRSGKAEAAEGQQDRSSSDDQPGRHQSGQELFRSDTAGEREESGPYPSRVSSFSSEDGAIGSKLGPSISGILDAFARVFQLLGALREFSRRSLLRARLPSTGLSYFDPWVGAAREVTSCLAVS